MKFLLSIVVFFTLSAANLLEAYRTTGCRDGPGVLKIICMHVNLTSDCQTGSYYQIEGMQANPKNWATNLWQYQKGNLKKVDEFKVQSCRQAEEAVHRAIRNGEFKVVENSK